MQAFHSRTIYLLTRYCYQSQTLCRIDGLVPMLRFAAKAWVFFRLVF